MTINKYKILIVFEEWGDEELFTHITLSYCPLSIILYLNIKVPQSVNGFKSNCTGYLFGYTVWQ